MLAVRDLNGRFAADAGSLGVERALARFRKFCEFEAATGCVVWTGGTAMGRGHHVPYGAFWFAGRRWFAHRWAAKYIHGHEIEELQVDHCCPGLAIPNTLCVQHVQPLSSERNRHLQTERRRRFVHLQVGLVQYEEIYGYPVEDDDSVPFYAPPAWLGLSGDKHDDPCPF